MDQVQQFKLEQEFRSIVGSLKNYAGHFNARNAPVIKMLVARLSELTDERIKLEVPKAFRQ